MAEIALTLSDADVDRIAAAVAAKLAALAPQHDKPADALISEAEGAALLDVQPHVLRDARKRGLIDFYRVGRFVKYSADQLDAFKSRQRQGGGK